MSYGYDPLNRLRSTRSWQFAGGWSPTPGNIFAETFHYDPAGNILRATRRDQTGALMDDLTYFYDPARRHNRLRGVRDAVTGAQTGDLSSRMATETSADNYAYDASGNLISDTQGGLSTISWNLSGKLRSVTRADGQTVEYRYDAAGQRVAQTADGRTTHYLRDASGNVMAIYEETLLTEHHLYGSSRLGTRRQGEAPRTRTLGHKSYELSNHLSNVMAVVSDHKLPDGNSWRARLQSRTDYYAFGAAMPGRSGGSPYRHGLNGQEKGGLFNGHYTALYWEYDSRLGRRWNVDPKPNESISNYATFGLNPILNADPQGDTLRIRSKYKDISKYGLYYNQGKLYTDASMTQEYKGRGYNSKKGTYKGFLKHVLKDLNTLEKESGSVGEHLIKYIVNHRMSAAIEEGSDNNQASGLVKYNPHKSSIADDSAPWHKRPAFIALAHELAHAQDYLAGTIRSDENTDLWFVITSPEGKVNKITISEMHAVGIENEIREFHNQPIRTHYGFGTEGSPNLGQHWNDFSPIWQQSSSYRGFFPSVGPMAPIESRAKITPYP